MFCKHCGNKHGASAKFCSGCGKSTLEITQPLIDNVQRDNPSAPISQKLPVVLCNKCGQEGPGELNRNTASIILAWLCFFISFLITLIYYASTPKYKCGNCASTDIKIKRPKGEYTKQGSATRPFIIIIYVLLAIAIIGIIASVILASMSSAREKTNSIPYNTNIKE